MLKKKFQKIIEKEYLSKFKYSNLKMKLSKVTLLTNRIDDRKIPLDNCTKMKNI